MERGHRQSYVLVLYCVVALAPSAVSQVLDSCSVMFPVSRQNSCNLAWMLDVTGAELAPFTDCKDEPQSTGVNENDRGATSTSPTRPILKKSVCAQIDINIADLTYISVHVCKCLNCSLVTKTAVLERKHVWSPSRTYKSGFPSPAPISRHIYCLRRLLTTATRTFCHIQKDPTRHVILCQTESAHSENMCFQIWWQHRMCEGYLKCKTHSSNHTCHSLFERKVHILQTPNIHEESISLRNQRISQNIPSGGLDLTERGLLSAGVQHNEEDIYSSFNPCSNCTILNIHLQKRDTACPVGFFGPACEETCHCQYDKRCHMNGSCLSGICTTGWRGVSCSKRACPLGRYGFIKNSNMICQNKCNCPRDECDVVHGACLLAHCSNVTPAVKETFDCFEDACPRRKLLVSNCSDTCHCYRDAVCDSVSGHCPTAICNDNFVPPTCSKPEPGGKIYWRSVLLFAVELVLILFKVGLLLKLRLLPKLVLYFRMIKASPISQ